MEDHVHGPECEEQDSEYRGQRAALLIEAYDAEKRDALLQAAHGAIEKMRGAHADLTDAQLGQVMESIGHMIQQVMSTPAYALSDTLTDSTAVYMLGSAHLLAAFELPEKAEDLPPVKWGEFSETDEATAHAASAVTEDDFRPGNYL
jgi:hypothetical protein